MNRQQLSGQGKELFDGLMLSDAQLISGKRLVNPYFSIGLSGSKHLLWLREIKKCLKRSGIPFADKYPVTYKCMSKGKFYIKAVLNSACAPLLLPQYYRWYKEGVKIVPLDLTLTPVTLAYWFMGDGHSSFKHSQWTLPGNTSVEIGLATNKFSLKEVDFLIDSLQRIGFRSARRWAAGKKQVGQYRIHIGEAGDIISFMKTVEPYLAPVFLYKIKYPKLSHKFM